MNSTTRDKDLEPEYDFTRGERGKFHRPDVVLHIPIYLDPDVEQYIRELAGKTGYGAGQLVNEWLRNSINILRSIEPAEQA